jgi:hypothetical protein
MVWLKNLVTWPWRKYKEYKRLKELKERDPYIYK